MWLKLSDTLRWFQKLSDYWDYSNVKYFSKACLIDNVFDRNPSVVNPYFNEPFHPAWLDE